MKSAPKIYAISDGRAGIERQAQALASAIAIELECDFETKRIAPKGLQTYLPPQIWPYPLKAISKEEAEILQYPPDIWIANGRKSIAYSLYIKRKFPNILTIQIQDPKIPSSNFDFVIAPKHDETIGKNVYETLGGLVFYSNQQIENAQNEFLNYKNETREKIMIILGGNSKTHKFETHRAFEIVEQLKNLQNENKVFWISTSRRTPSEVAEIFRKFAQENNHVIFENEEKDGKNPYLAWLSLADYAIITEDSANMLSDAAFFKLPIHIIKLQGSSKKFDRLHNSFIKLGAAIWFDGKLSKFSYNDINSVNKIAKSIIALWQNK